MSKLNEIYKKYNGKYISRYMELKSELEKEGVNKKEIEEEIAYLEIIQKLNYNNYLLYGKNSMQRYRGMKIHGDRILRSLESFRSFSVFDEMSTDKMLEMTSKMSKYAFEPPTEKLSKEEIEERKNGNKEGLKIYKGYILKHYLNIYKKYGLEWKDPEYCLEHLDEIRADIPETQVHAMLRNDPEIFNLNDGNERILYELIGFYRSFMSWIDTAVGKIESRNIVGRTEEYREQEWGMFNIDYSLAYLKEHEGDLKKLAADQSN